MRADDMLARGYAISELTIFMKEGGIHRTRRASADERQMRRAALELLSETPAEPMSSLWAK